MSITYNTRTLAACAKRLRWIADRTPKTEMPIWVIIWRFQEGFRLQIGDERHERNGWMTHDSTTATLAEIESDIAKADQLAAATLELTIRYATENFDHEQLTFLSTQTDYLVITELAQAELRNRAHQMCMKAC